MHELPFFILIKYSLYFGVLAASHKMLQVEDQNVFDFSFKWAGIKFLLGLLFGIAIAGISSWSESAGYGIALSYILSFGIVRVIEWLVLFKLVANYTKLKNTTHLLSCVALGVAASLLSDLVWSVVDFNVPKFFC